jgi:hypothetical protein
MMTAMGTVARADDGKDGMRLLQEARALMQELAEKRLPAGDCGEKVRGDEKKIIDNFDALIKMILDQSPDPSGGSSDPSDGDKQPDKPKSVNPQDLGKGGQSGRAGTQPNGNPNGGSATSGTDSSDPTGWRVLPTDKTFSKTEMAKGTVTVPGYEKLIEAFRNAIGRARVTIP